MPVAEYFDQNEMLLEVINRNTNVIEWPLVAMCS